MPLSPFSQKQILARYAAEPIRLRRDDALNMIINSTRIKNTRRSRHILRSELTFDLGYKIDTSPQALLRIGYQVHLYHIDAMVKFLDGVKFTSGAPYGAIRDYCLSVGIDDDDIGYDTLYKSYQRKSAKYAKKIVDNVLKDSRIWEKIDFDFDQLVAGRVISYVSEIYDKKNRFKKRVFRQIYIDTDIRVNGLSPRQAAKKYGLHISNIYRIIFRMDQCMKANWHRHLLHTRVEL